MGFDTFGDDYYSSRIGVLRQSQAARRKAAQQAASAKITSPTPPPTVKITKSRCILPDDLEFLQKVNPGLVMQMMRNRFEVFEMPEPPLDWLNVNCQGFYRIVDSQGSADFLIDFESEDDLVLFKTRWEGTSEE